MTAAPDRAGAEPISFVGVSFDIADLATMLEAVSARTAADRFAYIVTANVDHVVRLHETEGRHRDRFAASYRQADWRLCDSRILSRLARLRGRSLPVVTGSDLTARIFAEVVDPGDHIAVIGGDEDVAEALCGKYPALHIHFHFPPMGLADNLEAQRAAAAFVARVKPRFTFLAVGSPQQELLAALISQTEGATGTGLCIGAAIAFVTGHSRRAPLWMQRAGLEWLDRLMIEPTRLWRRYLVEGPRVFRIAFSNDAFKGSCDR